MLLEGLMVRLTSGTSEAGFSWAVMRVVGASGEVYDVFCQPAQVPAVLYASQAGSVRVSLPVTASLRKNKRDGSLSIGYACQREGAVEVVDE